MEIENDKIQKFKSKGMSAMGLNLITRLYGVGMNINFYSLQMRDFLQIFYDIERVIFIEKFIHPESYFIANPVDNAYLQNGEGIINLTSEFEQPQIIDVLKLVISYDLTTTIVMFFFLGLLKEINTLEQLSIILKIPYEQIDQLIIEGVNRLDNDVQQKKSIRMSKQQTVS